MPRRNQNRFDSFFEKRTQIVERPPKEERGPRAMTSAQERALGSADMFYLVFHYVYTHPHAQRAPCPEVPGEGSLFYDLFVVSKAFFFQKRLRLDLVCRAFRAHIREMPHARRLAAQAERWKNEPAPFYASLLSEMEGYHVGTFDSVTARMYTGAFETTLFREGSCEGMACMNPGCGREAYGDDGPARVPFCAECAPLYMRPAKLDRRNGEELVLPDDAGQLEFWLNEDDGAVPGTSQRGTRYVGWRLQQPYVTVLYLARVVPFWREGESKKDGQASATARRLTDAHRGAVERLCGQLSGWLRLSGARYDGRPN